MGQQRLAQTWPDPENTSLNPVLARSLFEVVTQSEKARSLVDSKPYAQFLSLIFFSVYNIFLGLHNYLVDAE